MERILQSAPFTPSETFYDDGVIVDPGTVTVGVTRADGTILIAAGTATNGTGAAARTFALTIANTALLDTLTVTWTSATKGIRKSTIEVVGGFLFGLADLKSLFPSATASDLAEMRTLAEQRLEKACGQAFVPRYSLETFDGTGTIDLQLAWPNVRSVRSAAISGTAVTLSTITLGRYRVNLSTGWTAGYGNVVIGYEHGRDAADEDIRQAALLVAQETFGSTDSRVVRREADGQAVTLASPSATGPFVDPVLRSIVRDNDLNIGIA
jgi:hypothetical protein